MSRQLASVNETMCAAGVSRSRVSAVVLAAGASSRMGRPKLFLELGGRSIISRVVESASSSRVMETVVVLGHGAEVIAREIAGFPARAVLNPDYASGMASSLRVGLGAVSPEAEAALILLGDQPLVTPDVINRIIKTFETAGKPIVAPVYNGVQGNPVCFARALFPALSALQGDRGAKTIVGEDPSQVEWVIFETDLPLKDLDVEEDYDALRRYFP